MTKHHQDIDDKCVASAKRFLKEERLLLECLIEVDRERVFERLGYASLFQYATLRLKLSESIAYAFIGVARRARTVPEIKTAVTDGKLSVSQAKRILGVVEPANASHWIDTAANHTQQDLERLVAAELPAPLPSSRVRPVGGDMNEMRLVIPDSLRKDIERLQVVRGCALIEAISFAVADALKRHDPVRKAERNLRKSFTHQPSLRKAVRGATPSEKKASPPAAGGARPAVFPSVAGVRLPASARRSPVPATQVHQVMQRDQGQCTFTYRDGTRCPSRYWIQLHHRVPVYQGGSNSADNLTTLCAQHHRIHHEVLRGRFRALAGYQVD